MPNTTIQLKKSSTPSSKPLDLANGELAINFADGKLYYKNTANFVVEFTGGGSNFGTVSANGTLLVSDTAGDILTIAAGNNINIAADALTDRLTISLSNDVLIPVGGTLKVSAVGGDEGGEIKLANAITNSVLVNDVIVDIYQNKIRFFESGGTNRGAFINLASAGVGVSTDILASISGVSTATLDGANTAVGAGANAFASATIAGANTAVGAAANAFAVATFGTANNTPVGNTLSNSFTSRSTRRTLNFIPGSNITINVDDDSAGNRANITITSTASGSGGAAIPLTADAVNATRYILFANNLTGNLVTANVDAGFTFNPSSNTLTINGALNAITKSFVITHPTRNGMMLRYGSLEGPENGVYARGRVQGYYIYLPDYWEKLVDEHSITVSLTPIGKTKMPSVLSWNNEKIVLHSDTPIDCFYYIVGERKDVDKLIVEY